MNRYINLERIEFVVTDNCSGKCKHCSNGERLNNSGSVNADSAVYVVEQLAKRFEIKSVMTFGGEPLLFADTVCKIHTAARDCGIPKRQLITNGFFTNDSKKIDDTAKALYNAGINEILLSIDAFHQEFIPLEPVIVFAEALLEYNASFLQIHPAWVIDENHDNPYNNETKRLLNIFHGKGINSTNGNNIFPSGNAVFHLAEYFPPPSEIDLSGQCGSFPYTSRLDDIDCFGINPNGDVNLCAITIGNIYNDNILDIVDNYDPYGNSAWCAVLNGGVAELIQYAQAQGVSIDISDCHSPCGICRKVMAKMQ